MATNDPKRKEKNNFTRVFVKTVVLYGTEICQQNDAYYNWEREIMDRNETIIEEILKRMKDYQKNYKMAASRKK